MPQQCGKTRNDASSTAGRTARRANSSAKPTRNRKRLRSVLRTHADNLTATNVDDKHDALAPWTHAPCSLRKQQVHEPSCVVNHLACHPQLEKQRKPAISSTRPGLHLKPRMAVLCCVSRPAAFECTR